MSRSQGRFARSKARHGDSLRHQIPAPCPHPPPPPSSTGFTLIGALFTTQTLTIRRLCCHSSQSWQGKGRWGINWDTFYFSKYINSHDSFYWQIFHEPLTLDIFMHIKSTFLRLRPVQKNISSVFLHLGDNYH